MHFYRTNTSWFTLIELIVWMTIFAIWLSGIYALLQSIMGNASYSRHEIVVANLLREEIELIKNIRDTNIRNFLPWDSALIISDTWIESQFSSWIYIVENDYATAIMSLDASLGQIKKSPVYMKRKNILPTDTWALWESMRLYIDDQGRYTHTLTSTGTPYASYLNLIPLSYIDGGSLVYITQDGKPQWYIIDARVIVRSWANYREYDAKNTITDWIK